MDATRTKIEEQIRAITSAGRTCVLWESWSQASTSAFRCREQPLRTADLQQLWPAGNWRKRPTSIKDFHNSI
ncbi:hypothetical protein RvY_17602 [Ramazzottius varieornatus]|uniref:Uncharacterized protein n=1 Tax=Ramazzottius varieornatus TaxID=947166 RepID=A0A1D1W2Q7_RAMVA|nr:hypothetical protein RvY_17602 [Ramazzottius varieornatus]